MKPSSEQAKHVENNKSCDGQGFVIPVATPRPASDGCSPSSRPGGEAALRGRRAQVGVRSGGETVYHQDSPRQDLHRLERFFFSQNLNFLNLPLESSGVINIHSQLQEGCWHRLWGKSLQKGKCNEKEMIYFSGQGSEKDSTSCVICMTGKSHYQELPM